MSEPDTLILAYLRRIDEKIDRVVEDLREVKCLDRIERRLDLAKTGLSRS